MNATDEQTLTDLEFDVLRLRLAGYCVQPTARQRLHTLAPLHREEAVRNLHRTGDWQLLRSEGHVLPAIDFEELQIELALLSAAESMLGEEGIRRIHRAVQLTHDWLAALKPLKEAAPFLSALAAHIEPKPEVIDMIIQVFDARWQVRDDASPALAQLRTAIADTRRQVARNFSKVMRECAAKGLLSDSGESYINQRKVLAVNSTYKRKVPGLVLGTSKSGNVTYIEPEVNMPLNAELELLYADEREEIARILRQLTARLRKYRPFMEACHELLCELDYLQATVRLSVELNATVPELTDETLIDLRQAYHPLLWLHQRERGMVTRPQQICMDKLSRFLVISGPNAGGKSVTLKTLGLLQIMLQCGLPVPVAGGSRMTFFQHVLSDIGDNQSISNQLSTYSYRLRRMKTFLQVANRRTLILLDEFGTGSDPDLGGALAEVFFEELYNRKCFGVITTHYTNIKLKASALRNAVNGCMLFNRETLEPVYQLSVGEPGSSFTFEVAEMNGISRELIHKAKARLTAEKVNMDALLSALQEEKTRLEHLSRTADEAAHMASQTIHEFDRKREKLEEKLKRQQELIERNNKFLASGKKMEQFISRYVLNQRNAQLIDEVKKFLAMEKTKQEEVKRERALKKKSEQQAAKRKPAKPQGEIKVGSVVKLMHTRQTGTVLEMAKGEATVAFGVFKAKVALEKLEWIK